MYCRQCGYNNDQYSKVCHRCGSIIREAEDLYDKEPQESLSEQSDGTLKYAKQSENLISRLKAPFRKLERANRRQKTSMMFIIAGAAVLLCIAVWLTVLGVKSCNTVSAAVYGNTSANISFDSIAASDGDFIYYSCPFGPNPGLYRLSVSSGETLKISYLCMNCLSVADGWIYGITPDGLTMRVSTDGLKFQQVLEETDVSRITVVNDTMFFLGKGACLYRADLSAVSSGRFARTARVGSSRMSEFIIYEDVIYYIDLPESEYTDLFTVSEKLYYETEDGKQSEENAYYIDRFVEPDGADVPEHPGFIWKMQLDGSDAAELLGTPVMRLTAGNGYLFFQSEAVLTVSATDIDPKAPEDMDYDLETTKCWRLELETLKYSSLLDMNIAGSAMNPADNGWIYYITVDGTLERTTTAGKDHYDVLTYEQSVDRIAVVGDYIFLTSDNESRLIMMHCDGSGITLLSEKLEAVEPTDAEEK